MGATSFYKCHHCNQMHSYGYECVPDPADQGLDQADEGLFKPPPAPESPLTQQVAGSHYKSLKIQPIEYIHANGIPFAEGCVIKYMTRWRDKGGIKDLEKAKHFIELLIELETRNGKPS